MAPPARRERITKPKLLIGEGRDEVNFFEALLKHVAISDTQVESYSGKNGLAGYLNELRARRPGRSRLKAIAVTRDVDKALAQDFQSVCGALGKSGFGVPQAPGQVLKGKLSVGVFLFPDNHRQGMLEDLCLDAAAGDAGFPCIDAFFQCIRNQANRTPTPVAKARMHAWLASQIEPDLRLGEAANKPWWPWNHPAFEPLKKFILSF